MAKRRPADLDQFRKSLRPAQRRELDRLIAARDAEIVRCAVAAAAQSIGEIGEMVHAFAQEMMQSIKGWVQLHRSTLAEVDHLQRELHRQPQYRRRILAARKAEILKMSSEGKSPKQIHEITRRHWPGVGAEAVRQIISRAKPL
jgi:hypothetical protein